MKRLTSELNARLIILIVTLSMFVLSAGAPSSYGGVGG